MQLIDRVRHLLREQYGKRGKQDLFAALNPLLSSALPENESFTESAARLGVTENALRVSLHRLRSDFRDLLFKEVQSTLDEGEDARAEIRHLLTLFE